MGFFKTNTSTMAINKVKLVGYQNRNVTTTKPEIVFILGVQHFIYFHYKNVKSPTMHLMNHTIQVILPNKYKKIEKSQILKILVDKLYDKIAMQEIEKIMEKTRLTLGFAPEDYAIEKLPNQKVATCLSTEQKIVIDPTIMKYDKKTIEYIILHEFCHLKYKIHTKNFWQMIRDYIPAYEQHEKNNLKYGISY